MANNDVSPSPSSRLVTTIQLTIAYKSQMTNELSDDIHDLNFSNITDNVVCGNIE